MSVVSVRAKDFILALFIRDDGERFLLGDNGYDFKDSQLHFSANTIENDEVQKQGADGVMLAGQVRRSSVQSFDGYVGDATTLKETIEEMRRDFIAFFAKGHHFRVIYIDTARNAWQRKGGYLVDAPEVKELYQIHPDYHVGLNFEDVNYYSYDEDKDGNEILSNLIDVPVSTDAEGGLVWDEDGAVSEDAGDIYYDTAESSASGKSIAISDATEAPLASFQLDGETSQNGTPTPSAPVAVQTVTGENLVKITGKNLFDKSNSNLLLSNVYIGSSSLGTSNGAYTAFIECSPNTTYTISKTAGARFICGTTTTLPATGVAIANRTAENTASSITLTTSSTAKYLVAFYFLSSADSGTQQAMLDSLQFESGSTATAYEPYQGQSYEVNLGKNLFNVQDTSNRGVDLDYDSTTGKMTLSGTPSGTWCIFALPSTTIPAGTYTISIQSALSFIIGLGCTNASGTRTTKNIAVGSTSYSFTINESMKLDLAVANLTSGTAMSAEIFFQLEKGSTATSYAAYFEPIELCKIGDYQDYIYKSDGKWYVRKEVGKYTFDGSENWVRSGRTSASVFVAAVNISSMIEWKMGDDYKTAAKSDLFIAGATNAIGHFDLYNGTNFYTSIALMFDTTTIPDITAAKAWITANTPSVYAILATPTDTEITNQALIAQLEALLTTARTFAGINNIFTITPNEQGSLEISYYTKYQPVVSEGGYIWEAGGAGGATTVINNSIGNVNPVWTVYGPTNNPQLENSTTGEVIEYVGLIAEGQTLTIDMSEQTASLDGLNVISNVIGDYISLAPGANRLIYSVSGDAGASEIGWSEIVG